MFRKRIVSIAALCLTFPFLASLSAQSQRSLPAEMVQEVPPGRDPGLPTPENLTTPLEYKRDNVAIINTVWTDIGTTGTRVRVTDTDNDNSLAQSIGFMFRFRGMNFNQFVMNTNGFIKLGNQPPSRANLFLNGIQGFTGGALYSTSVADTNILSIFNTDLVSATAAVTDLRVLTTGTAPNRVCTIQWKNVRDKPDPTGAAGNQFENMAFQIKLYETTNYIDFVYGPFVSSTNGEIFRTASCGLKGATPAQTLAAVKSSLNDWTSTAFATGANTGSRLELDFRNSVPPEVGQTFRFVTPLAKNVGVREIIDVPVAGCTLPTSSTIGAVFSNGGLDPQNNIPVGLKVDNVIFRSTIARLDTNQVDTVYFSGVDLSVVGPHVIRAFSALVGDQLPGNDTVRHDTVYGIAPIQPVGDTNSFETDIDRTGIVIYTYNGVDNFGWGLFSGSFSHHGNWYYACKNLNRPNNDWLVTRCYDLKADSTYRFHWSYRDQATTMYDIWVMDSPNPSGPRTMIFSDTLTQNQITYTDTSAAFSVDTAGNKYIGIHVYSLNSQAIFILDDIAMSQDTNTVIIANRPYLAGRNFTIAPNPAQNRISISGANMPTGDYFALMADGKRIRLETLAADKASRSFRIGTLKPGIYTLCDAAGRQLGRFAKASE